MLTPMPTNGRTPIVERDDGTRWVLTEPVRTSDGHILATGLLLDPETDTIARDEAGFPVLHQFYLTMETC